MVEGLDGLLGRVCMYLHVCVSFRSCQSWRIRTREEPLRPALFSRRPGELDSTAVVVVTRGVVSVLVDVEQARLGCVGRVAEENVGGEGRRGA